MIDATCPLCAASCSVQLLCPGNFSILATPLVHPARRRRTHSITVTVRSAHSMAQSSSTSESDSLPVSSARKAQRWYESQSRRLNNEGENLFPRFARTDRHYAPLGTFQSQYKIASYGPAQYRHPTFNISRSAPAACTPRLPLTQWTALKCKTLGAIVVHTVHKGCRGVHDTHEERPPIVHS